MRKKRKGFTLIELIIVLAIMATILGSIYLFFLSNTRGLNSSEANVNLQDQAQDILDTMSKDFMEARIIEDINNKDNVNSKRQTSCNIATVTIKPLSGDNITYLVNNGVLQRRVEGLESKEIAKYIDSINIESVDGKIFRDDTENAPRENSTKSVKIVVNLKMKNSNKNYEYEASSNIVFRNADMTD